jgi:uncharacterized protein YjbJ (UPF0337 family)
MGLGDKIENAAQKAKGTAKEKVGETTDDDKLAAEGKVDKMKADVKQAGEKIKDAFTDR